ncbi:hypothetical protein [Paenibacillus sp. MMS20-IR301]|uniref:hypothetical protein n=1 Tax=Paenibacillus sp. MMS20-IR301 TaxID=2895946 RepID=UPI0028E24D57|nr:hypothetical protein [Paenibacillus sp. MMS20-IR301]WNS41039.1 hypothetical protein LOS79_18505 [Paenibacillus sp. MMS20-IR301]
MTARIVLAVRESQYIEPLLHYLHHSSYGEMLRITAFSRLDTFMEFMKGNELPDAVAGDASFIEAWLVEGRSSVPWAVLSEAGEMPDSRNSPAGGRVIAKYQALPSLLESILQLCDLKRARTAAVPKEQTLLLGVVSASGGSGKTTVALNIAKQLGALGLSVFYLNLESVDSSGMYLRMPGGNVPGLERLLYELKAGGESNGGRGKPAWADYAFRHEVLRCDAFRPVENFKEMLQMSQRDTLDILDGLAGAGSYDVVIADTGSIEEERAQAVLRRCGSLLWILKNEQVSLYKTERWLAYYGSPHSGMTPEMRARSRFVLNCCTETGNELPAAAGIRLEGILPYIPSWGTQHYGELCLSSPQFIAAVQQLCRTVVEPALPGVFTGSSA